MRALLLCAAALLLLSPDAAFALDAAVDVSDPCQMQWIRDHRDGPGTVAPGFPLDVPGSGVQWQVTPPPGLLPGQWWDIQIGDAYDTPSAGSGLLNCYGFPIATGFADWTGYTSFTLTFSNCSATDWFMADILVHTGWTNPPFNEPDTQYAAGWTWVAPGQTVTLAVDLTSAVNLNHVSNISFKLGTNFGTNPYEGTAICATVGPVDYVAPDPTGLCISTATPCVTVPVNLVQASGSSVRGASVTLQLSPELQLCGAGFQPGPLFSNPPWGSASPYFYVLNNGGGSYTIDYSILGAPCGPNTGGLLFTMDVGASPAALPDDTGTITVTSVIVRDCVNQPVPAASGPPALIPIDRTGPAAIADLVATQVKTGNDSDGTTKIQLTFTPPGDAVAMAVYRAPFGNYPEYDDPPGAGSVPLPAAYPPPAPWVLTAVAGSPGFDEVAVRDFWYYAAYTWDGCGNVSAASNMTPGTLNYHLGDVTDGVTPGTGDNLVGTIDITLLGINYGNALVPGDLLNYLDVGPTTDFSVNARPTTDNLVQFEDLMMFAINYGSVSKPGILPGGRNAITVHVPADGAAGLLEVSLELSSNGLVQGVSVPLRWNADIVEPVDFVSGELLQRQNGMGVAFSPAPGIVDATVFGSPLSGEGILATVRFRIIGEGDPGIGLGEVTARDAANRPIALDGAVMSGGGRDLTPVVTQLLPSAPNPFRAGTTIAFSLAAAGPARIQVYGFDGRLVRTLIDGVAPAGESRVAWDGRDNRGRDVAAGMYVVRFEATGHAISQRVVRLQ